MTDPGHSTAGRTERPSLAAIADVFDRATATSPSEAEARQAPSYMDRSLRGVTG